ncbi:MAG: hypothetical protein WCR02_11545 [Sphaerochaetaceae bacterium]
MSCPGNPWEVIFFDVSKQVTIALFLGVRPNFASHKIWECMDEQNTF